MRRTFIVIFVWLHANIVSILVHARVGWVLRKTFVTKEETYSIGLAIAQISNATNALHIFRDVKVVIYDIKEVVWDAVELCLCRCLATDCFKHVIMKVIVISSDLRVFMGVDADESEICDTAFTNLICQELGDRHLI